MHSGLPEAVGLLVRCESHDWYGFWKSYSHTYVSPMAGAPECCVTDCKDSIFFGSFLATKERAAVGILLVFRKERHHLSGV